MDLKIVHTGQHYDYEMSKLFFDELELPDPIVNLNVGSGSHAFQTGKMMIHLEKVILNLRPAAVIVPGDTNSALAGALVTVKQLVPVAHLEAGARSYDMKMPEEVNRRMIDHCSALLFSPTKNCMDNLRREHVIGKIYCSGDTLYDAFSRHIDDARTDILQQSNIEAENYVVVTLHRAENVDNPERLRNIVAAMLELRELPVVFPVHPRTLSRFRSFGLIDLLREARHIKLIKPVRYGEMLSLLRYARLVFTDSGGVQKESFWANTPCVTLRENTEWIETVNLGGNVLAGATKRRIVSSARSFLQDQNAKGRLRAVENPFGNGNASKKVVKALLDELA